MEALFERWEGIGGKSLVHCIRCDKRTPETKWPNTTCATGTCRRRKRPARAERNGREESGDTRETT
jgi:hypothetical protein